MAGQALPVSYRFCGDGRNRWVSGGARCSLRHDRGGCCRHPGGEEGGGKIIGRAAGDECVFTHGEGAGLVDEAGSTPRQTRRAVRTVTGPLDRIA